LTAFLLTQIDWHTDCFYTFLHRWTDRVRQATSESKIIFVEGIPNEVCLYTTDGPSRDLSDCRPCSYVRPSQLQNVIYRIWFMRHTGRIAANASIDILTIMNLQGTT
jgi:hypothetical protein